MQIINEIKVCEEKDCRTTWLHGIEYYVCSVCGRMSRKGQTRDGRVLCSKHYKQEWRHGKMLDQNPRTGNDLNEIRVLDDHAEMDIYDRYGNVVATALISIESIEDVRFTKWCLGSRNYIITNRDPWGNRNSLHRLVMHKYDNDLEVDHINNNPLDNRLQNLRVVSHLDNTHNFAIVPEGVRWHEQTGKWLADITEQNNHVHLGLYTIRAEAVYARNYAEQTLRRTFACNREIIELPKARAKEIEEKVRTQLRKYIDIDGTGQTPPLAWDNPDRPRPIHRRDVKTPERKSRD